MNRATKYAARVAFVVIFTLLSPLVSIRVDAQSPIDDYATDPVRQSYRLRVPYALVPISHRSSFVAEGADLATSKTTSVVRLKLRDGRRLVLNQERPQELRSIAQNESAVGLFELLEAAPPSAIWHAASPEPEDRVVADWRAAEKFWGEQLPDPRSLYYVSVPEADLESTAFAFSQLPIVEYVDIASYTEARETAGNTDTKEPSAQTSAATYPPWYTEMEIATILQDTGLVGRTAEFVLASKGVPVGGPGLPPISPFSAFGPFAALSGDNDDFAMAALCLPKARFGCVRVDPLTTQDGQDFAGGLNALIGRQAPMVYSGGYHLVLGSGLTLPMEYDGPTFHAIKTLTGAQKTVVIASGRSGINLFDVSRYPPQVHQPFFNDSGAIIVQYPIPPTNFGERTNFRGHILPNGSGSTNSIAIAAAYVEDALQMAGQSVPGQVTAINGSAANRTLLLEKPLQAIRQGLSRFPNPMLRMQTNAPDHELLVLGQFKSLGEIPHLFTKQEGLKIYNDGGAPLSFTASVQVIQGSDNTACTIGPSGGSVPGGKGSDLTINIFPRKPGVYACRLDLDVNDPRPQMPLSPSAPGKRRWHMTFTFRVPTRPGSEIRVEDILGNPVTSGQLFDFGTLAATDTDDFQTKVVVVHNEIWADRDLVIDPPSFPLTARFKFVPEVGPHQSSYTIRPGEEKAFLFAVYQHYDLVDGVERLFEENINISTNDSNHSTFTVKGRVRLRNRNQLFEILPGAPGYLIKHDDRWSSLDLGNVSVDESGTWTLKQWGGFRSLLKDLKVKWIEYTGPVDALFGLEDKDAVTIGKVAPIDKVIQASEIVDIAVNILVRPPKAGRTRQAMVIQVTPPGEPTKEYYVVLTAGLVGTGPAHFQAMKETFQVPIAAGVVANDAVPLPINGTVAFDRVAVGSSVRRRLQLHNNGTTGMTVRGLRFSGNAYSAELSNATIPSMTYVNLDVTLHGLRRGPAQEQLSFYIDGTGEADNFFTMNLAGEVCEGSNCASSTPVVNSFAVQPEAVSAGQPATLSWNVSNTTSVSIAPGIGTVGATGTRTVSPTQSTDYVLTAVNGSESVTRSARLIIVGDGPAGSPSITSFTATPTAVATGQSSTLGWIVTGATSLSLAPGGPVSGTGQTVTPSSNTTYVLSATNASGTSTRAATVTVGAGAGVPIINTFTAMPDQLAQGDSTTLTWDVGNTTTVELSPGIGAVTAAGTRTLTPAVSTLYTLRSTNPAGSVTSSQTVTVAGTTGTGVRPVIESFTTSSTTAAAGAPVTLSWSVRGADVVVLAPPLTAVNAAGSQTVQSEATTTYTLFARNSAGSVSQELTVTVTGGPVVPSIQTLRIDPQPIVRGGGGEIRWATSGATSVQIAPDIGLVALSGVKSIKPGIDFLYVLTATNSAGSIRKAVVVKTEPPPPEPLTKPLELLRGTDVATGIRLEQQGTTNLYDPIRGYVSGSIPILIVNRSASAVTIDRAAIDTYGGGSNLFSITSELRGITLLPEQSVPVTLRWNNPKSPRGYNAFLGIYLRDGTSMNHSFSIAVPEWKQEGTSLSAITLTDAADTQFAYNLPAAPLIYSPDTGLDLGLANTDLVATRLMRVHNNGDASISMIQAWCAGTDFSIRPAPLAPFPISIAPHSHVTLLVTATDVYDRYRGDTCFVQTQRSAGPINHGTFMGFKVEAAGSDQAPAPRVIGPDGIRAEDFSTHDNAREYVIPRLRPNRAATLLFGIYNSYVQGGNYELHLAAPIQVSGSGFRLERGYHAGRETIPPLLSVGGAAGYFDTALFKVQFTGKPSGTYTGVVKIPMWGGSRNSPPYDWVRTYEIHLKVQVGNGRIRVSQASTELDNGGGFDADEVTAFTVENTSDAPVRLSGLAVPRHYTVTSGLPHSLAPGQSATFALLQANVAATTGPHYVSFSVDDSDDPEFRVRENHKPIAVLDTAIVDTGDSTAIDVTANDTDADGDAVALSVQPIVTSPAKGSVVVTDDDVLVYTPNAGASGNDRFTYEISDGNGGVSRAEVLLNIDIANRNPVANPDAAQTKPARTVTIDVTANDRDPDGDPVSLIGSPVVVAPANGAAVKVDGAKIAYTPNSGFTGTDTFTYEVGDTFGKRARAEVTIEVANTKPVAVVDTASTHPSEPVTINVTANDYDEDGDPTTLITNPIVEAPEAGTAVKIDGASIQYTPNAGFAGIDVFTYEIGDSFGSRARAVVTVTVTNGYPVAVADTAMVRPNGTVDINVTANDIDPDGDPVVLIGSPVVVPPNSGTAVKRDGSTITYTPNAGLTGTDTFTYEVGDTYGSRARAEVTVNVSHAGGNTPPTARNDITSTGRDTPVTIDVLANDVDPDGQAIVLSGAPITTDPLHGAVIRLTNTSVTYTPSRGWSGNDIFQYEIVDASGIKDRAWVAVHVGRTTGLPHAVDDNATTNANQSVSIDVLANDSSPDGDPLALAGVPIIAHPANGIARRVSDSVVSYTPNAGFAGSDTFAYEIADSEGGTAAAFVTVTVLDTNQKPVANPDSASTSVGGPVTIDVIANDTDPDGDVVGLIANPIVVSPARGVATRVSSSSISYTPNAGVVGTDSFQYEIGDGNGKRARAIVTVTVSDTNHPPVAVDDSTSTASGVAVTINVVANDSDQDGDNVVLIGSPVATAPTNGTAVKISGTSITYTPRAGFSGTDRFQYEVGDEHAARARAWVDVTVGSGTVNHNPVAVNDDPTTPQNTGIDVVVTSNDSDPDGDAVALIGSPIIVAPNHGTATKLSGSTIRYTPAADYVGVDTLQYEIGDGGGKRSRAWVRVTVLDTNSPPVAADDRVSTLQGQAVTVNVVSNDSDPDGDLVRLITNPVVLAPAHGTAAKVDGLSIRYTPVAGYFGNDRFRYEVGDGRGGRHRAWVDITVIATSNAATGSVSALSISAVPPIAGNDIAETASNTAVPVVVLANDYTVNGRPVVLSAMPVITQPLFGTVDRMSDTTLTYTPSADFRGNDRFEYEVIDAGQTATRAWVTMQIPGDNKAPTGVDDVVTMPMSGRLMLTPLKNDTDPDGDDLALSRRAITVQPLHGTARRQSDTELAYTPEADFTGTDSLTYELSDGRGGTAEAIVTIHVVNGSGPPVSVNDALTAESGRLTTVNVLANDTDPDGDPLHIVGSVTPQHGSIVWSEDGTAIYQSERLYIGTDTFQYTVSDPSGLTAQATVSITVMVTNTPPSVMNDAAETKTRTPVLIGVLANDWEPDTGQALTVTSLNQPAHGTAVINNGTSVTYTPANTFAGNDTFQYTVSDGKTSVTGTVAVSVLNQAPRAYGESLAAPEDTWVSYQASHVLANDTDPDGDELHIVKIEQPLNGTFQIAADNSQFSYRAKANWYGIDSFYYTVSDPFGAEVRVLSQIGVSPVNDSPVANDDSFSGYRNQVLTLTQAQIVANDTDVEGDSIKVVSVGPATNGATQTLADGSVRYTPYGEYVGQDSFDYTVQDGGGAYASGRISVTVQQDLPPLPDFTVTCNGRACVFDASSSTDDRGIVSYQWTLGNGSTAAGKAFNYTYPLAGMFQPRLTVQDVLGQSASLSKVVNVTEPPPDARDDAFTWTRGFARSILYSSMLANDTDPSGDVLAVSSVDSSITNGTVTCDATGCVFAPPSTSWTGQTMFKYTLSDGHGQSDTATVTINFTN